MSAPSLQRQTYEIDPLRLGLHPLPLGRRRGLGRGRHCEQRLQFVHVDLRPLLVFLLAGPEGSLHRPHDLLPVEGFEGLRGLFRHKRASNGGPEASSGRGWGTAPTSSAGGRGWPGGAASAAWGRGRGARAASAACTSKFCILIVGYSLVVLISRAKEPP